MGTKLSRRNFLKLAGLGLGSLAFRPYNGYSENADQNNLVRVAVRSVSVYSKPNDQSQILFQRFRDELVNVYYEVISEDGPKYNPLWYRVWGGYIHSANLQRVNFKYNPVITSIPEGGQLAEVTIPFSQTFRYSSYKGWENFYRLYQTSTHWVMGVDEGPDGEPWYRLKDELLEIEYHAPAIHFRMIGPEEFAPISPEIPAHKKRIEVSIGWQKLTCYEDDQPVFETKISTGLDYSPPGELPWNTPKGEFHIYSKMPSKHMGDGRLSGNPEDYELPGVPWVCFFEETGVAFHGTWWHTDFGAARSHGCINLKSDEAKWLYRWTTPAAEPGEIEKRGYGTLVVVT